MRTYTVEELKKILELHSKWWRGETNGSRADLSRANLYGADLSRANLYGANLYGANLSRADLKDVVLPPFLLSPEGSFTAFKKVKDSNGLSVLLKLQIPADALRTNSTRSRKCRASKALVLEATRLVGVAVTEGETFYSTHDLQFIYRVGQTVEVPDFNPDIREECTAGIHYFITRQEAVEY